MKVIRLGTDHIPLTTFSVIRLETSSKETGVMIPDRKDMPPVWVNGDGHSVTVMPLGGEYAFRHFRLQAGSPIRGVIFRDVEISANVLSKQNHRADPRLGALMFQGGRAAVFASPSTGDEDDAIAFPLPYDFDASDEVPMSFTGWSFRKVVGDTIIEVWTSEPQAGDDA